MNNLPNKLELSLLGFLFQFGGLMPAELLAKEAALFDSIAPFAVNPVANRLLLARWNGVDANPFAGMTWYPGHCAVDMAGLPRTTVTCAQIGDGGGSSSGYDDCTVEILMRSPSGDVVGHAARHSALRDILCENNLRLMQAFMNFRGVPDNRAVLNFGLDAIRFKDQIEGRDEKTNQHGVRIDLMATAHLEGPGLI